MIGRWQKETNELLDGIYNGKQNHNFNVKVDILDAEEGKQDSDGSEDESAAPSSSVLKASKRKEKEDAKGKAKEGNKRKAKEDGKVG